MKNNLSKYFKRKKILITGHNGFKGSWMTILLHLIGAKIYGLSLKEKKDSLFRKAKIDKLLVKNYVCNINQRNKVEKLIIKINPDIIIHFAAQSLVIDAYRTPLNTYMTNVIGTLNILEASKKLKKLKKILITTTDKVYNADKEKQFNENDEIKGQDTYSSSKVCVEHVIYNYKKNYFNLKNSPNILVARSGNVIGGGDTSKNRIIPDIIKSIRNKKKLLIRSPKNIRPWQHVLDPLLGYLLLLSNKNVSKENYIWNFGPKKSSFQNVEYIVNKFKKQFYFDHEIIKNPFNETKTLKLNSFKSMKELKWLPKLNLNESINKIIEYEKFLDKNKNSLEICLKQASDYLKEQN